MNFLHVNSHYDEKFSKKNSIIFFKKICVSPKNIDKFFWKKSCVCEQRANLKAPKIE